jgi:GH25 family lysozyme M1 (1,4-beta-N-acetylmuramidase)
MNPQNYLQFNPAPQQEKLSIFKRAWRSALAVVQTWTHGDDLSHWNTVLNWFQKQAEMKFSILKLGEGGDPLPDSKLWQFVADAKASGTVVMVYWFFRSDVLGETQRDYALALLEQVEKFLGYKPFFWADVETVDNVANEVRLARLKILLDGVNAWNPGKVGIYTSPGFANTKLSPMPAWINAFWHWIAHWTSAALPTQPAGWSVAKCKVWQIGYWDGFSWCPPVPGCEPDIDRNKFYGDEVELAEFAGYVPPLPPPDGDYVTRAEFDEAVANLTLLLRPPMTHRVVTSDLNGEKLKNNPDSGEHIMLANGTEIRKLTAKKWKGMFMYGLFVGGYPLWGYLADDEVEPL